METEGRQKRSAGSLTSHTAAPGHPTRNRQSDFPEGVLCGIRLCRRPQSIRIATLLDKPDRRIQPVKVDYIGFAIPDKFVVGYGLDDAEDYRNLPDICVLSE
jgi:hypothetical protein